VEAAGSGSATAVSGVFQTRLAITAPSQGSLKLTASQGATTAEQVISVSSSCTPKVAAGVTGAPCAGAGQLVPIDLNVSGVPETTFNLVVHHVDLFGPAEVINRSQPVRVNGAYSLNILVRNAPGRVVPVTIEARETTGTFKYATANVTLPPACPPPSTPTTASPPAGADTTQPAVPPASPPPASVITPLPPLLIPLRPGRPAGPPSLSLSPSLGQAGQAATVTGTGFTPSATVTLRWQPGIGQWTVRAGGDGSFRTQVLVLPNDIEGRRTLEAVGEATASVSYLVVPAADRSAFGGVFLRG